MAQKTLEKGSVWEKADTNGDGVVSDQEMARLDLTSTSR